MPKVGYAIYRKGVSMERCLLNGNQTAARAASLAKVQFVSAYPTISGFELMDVLKNNFENEKSFGKFVAAESDQSALACVVGASRMGLRTFSATSSEGLAGMHDLLFWASYGRLPIVLANVNSSMSPGMNVWSDQTDSLSERDTGWIQIYCANNQEILDYTLIAYRLAEELSLPVMVSYDAFVLSHTYEGVLVPDQHRAAKFIKENKLNSSSVENQVSFYPVTGPEHYMEFRNKMEQAHKKVFKAFEIISQDFESVFERSPKLMEFYREQDAETLIIASGAISGTAKCAIDDLRKKGEKVGLCNLKMLRPFPREELKNYFITICDEVLSKRLLVLDQNISHGAGGIWAEEVKSALYDIETPPPINNAYVGLGGRDVTAESIVTAYNMTKGRVSGEPVWVDLKSRGDV